MDTVDNIEDAQPTEENIIPDDSVIGKIFTAETFNQAWRSSYLHLTETLRRVYEQIGQALQVEMSTQIPDFDPENNKEHKDLFERSVTSKVVEIGAQAEFIGMLKMGLVVYLDVGKRYGFETRDIVASLQALTQGTDVNKNVEEFKKEQANGSTVQEPVREEEAGT
jgi:hypothetical protein